MLEPTKKPHADNYVELCFKVRKEVAHEAEQAIKPFLAENTEIHDDEDSIPWRDALNIKEEEFPGRCLRGARTKEGVTQKELAKMIGIRQEHISAMENNRRPIGKAMAKRFAEVLNVDYRVFL
ncbi:helix-turn-helix transcriptional regulator [Maridesulfovibrio sp.]|uniref:helix-turn-helix domain-containing protein n=1 Tax=Maridesulfovibrio sp. TaxID=2795000 RepID=UPI002A186CF7|nr:helix-turn-helix transcriptional regulator [Maridesulfovibrio sp.]